MSKVTPFLWYNDQALEAANFYVSIFKNSKILNSNPMFVSFSLDGQEIMALNGGPEYKLNESFSLFVSCDGQEEVDTYWAKLTSDGGSAGQCGWLKDKYGLSWQIIPKQMGELLGNPDKEKSGRVYAAMRKMSKIIIKDLETA